MISGGHGGKPRGTTSAPGDHIRRIVTITRRSDQKYQPADRKLHHAEALNKLLGGGRRQRWALNQGS